MRDGPLDMRMGATRTSAEELNEATRLARIHFVGLMAKSAARAPLCVRLWCGAKGRVSPAPAN